MVMTMRKLRAAARDELRDHAWVRQRRRF